MHFKDYVVILFVFVNVGMPFISINFKLCFVYWY